ncbi:unnamed protein product [Calypogeia fissa]
MVSKEFWTLFYFEKHAILPTITTLDAKGYAALAGGGSVAEEGDVILLVHTMATHSELTIRQARGGVWRLKKQRTYRRPLTLNEANGDQTRNETD